MIKYLEKSSDFENETRSTCLVDFYADWCGPCKMLGTVLESIENDVDITILKVNTDTHADIATKFGVMSIPTIVLMEGEKVVAKHIGFMPKEQLMEFIKQK